MAWSTPVIDRTLADVDYIKSMLAKIKLIGYDNLTSGEKTEWNAHNYKGALNYSDLVRIDDNIKYLADTLNSYGYSITISYRGWNTGNIPIVADIDRIINNITAIETGFYSDPTSPTLVLGSRTMDYSRVNDIEKCILDLKVLVDGMEYSIKRCGTFNCGATIFL